MGKKKGRGIAESLTFSYAAYQQHGEEIHEGDQRRHPRAGKDPHPLQRPSAPAGKAAGQQDSQRLPSVVSTCGRTNAKGRALSERKAGSRHRRGREKLKGAQRDSGVWGKQRLYAIPAGRPGSPSPWCHQGLGQLHRQADWWGHEANLQQPPCLGR